MTDDERRAGEGRRCDDDQEKFCTLKMETILESIDDLKQDNKATQAVVDARTRDIFKKIDDVWDVLSGGGRSGTGINPRLMVVEVRTEKNEKMIERMDGKFEKYIEDRASFERKLVWGILTAIGTGVLGMVFSGISWLIGRVVDHG